MKEQIAIAAKWWADQLRITTKQDNGDALCNALVGLIPRDPPDPLKVNAFERELADRLPGYLARGWDVDNPMRGSALRTLGCDYGPGELLAEAAEASGIKPMCPPFPMKTVMWIDPDGVKVGHGYRAEPEILWTLSRPDEGGQGGEAQQRPWDDESSQKADDIYYGNGQDRLVLLYNFARNEEKRRRAAERLLQDDRQFELHDKGVFDAWMDEVQAHLAVAREEDQGE